MYVRSIEDWNGIMRGNDAPMGGAISSIKATEQVHDQNTLHDRAHNKKNLPIAKMTISRQINGARWLRM